MLLCSWVVVCVVCVVNGVFLLLLVLSFVIGVVFACFVGVAMVSLFSP